MTATQLFNVEHYFLINLHRTAIIANEKFEHKIISVCVRVCVLAQPNWVFVRLESLVCELIQYP